MDALLGTKSRGDAWGAKEEPLAEPQTLQSLNLQHVDDGTEYIDDADTGSEWPGHIHRATLLNHANQCAQQ